MVRIFIAVLISVVFTTALAGDFEDGIAAIEHKDYATALIKFRNAAQQGSVEAQFNLGLMYDMGHGVAQDYKEAVRWYQRAAQQGLAEAQYTLGLMYNLGQGIAQDYKEAVRWFRLAAKQRYKAAQHNLGVMYMAGQGVLQDYTRAHMWFNIAAVSGDKDSVKGRDLAASKMTAQQIEQAQRMARECMASNFTKCD
jgi:TPR repeat protein